MKEIIIYLIDKSFNDVDGCLAIICCFGLFVVIPIVIFLTMIIK